MENYQDEQRLGRGSHEVFAVWVMRRVTLLSLLSFVGGVSGRFHHLEEPTPQARAARMKGG